MASDRMWALGPSERKAIANNDAKTGARRRYCEQLDALGVDPYSPDVADDDRHGQVEALIAEYEAAVATTKPLPPGWEGQREGGDVACLPCHPQL